MVHLPTSGSRQYSDIELLRLAASRAHRFCDLYAIYLIADLCPRQLHDQPLIWHPMISLSVLRNIQTLITASLGAEWGPTTLADLKELLVPELLDCFFFFPLSICNRTQNNQCGNLSLV